MKQIGVARRWVIVLAMITGATVLPASAAFADHWPLCQSGDFCIYKNDDGHDGGVWTFGGDDSNYSGNTFERCFVNCDANDATSSTWNRESYVVRAHVDSGYSSSGFDNSSGQQRNQMPSGFNDALSSHRNKP